MVQLAEEKWVARTTAFVVRVFSLVSRRSKRTVMTKYPSEPKGRRTFDTALHYNTVDMIPTEKTRTAKPALPAQGLKSYDFSVRAKYRERLGD